MEESAKKRIPGSNLAKMSPEKRKQLEELDAALDQYLVEALKQGIKKNDEEWERLMEAKRQKKERNQDKD